MSAKHTPGRLSPERIHSIAREQFERHEGRAFAFEGVMPWVASAIDAASAPLLAALHEALEFVADQEDVTDGPDGEPVANKAMHLAQGLRDAIAKATGAA